MDDVGKFAEEARCPPGPEGKGNCAGKWKARGALFGLRDLPASRPGPGHLPFPIDFLASGESHGARSLLGPARERPADPADPVGGAALSLTVGDDVPR